MTAALDRIDGINLVLRLVTPGDAGFIHGLRTDPALNAYLSPVTGTADDQRAWIERYKAREAAGQEFYFVIERRDGMPCGTVRLYGIEGDRFTWGSWILDRNKPAKAALESAMLVYETAFERMGLARAVFDVRKGNAHTLAFHRRLGATQTAEDDTDLHFEYPAARFRADKPAHMAVIRAAGAA